ncbi:S-adenosyl-L-methionine-dependent methyltransferase [Aspergillus sclerotioniger CBS 115572]|uniref:S-adenosyl-L-methionine-dependent methyltransferase n=1 Tax=Aspergillus sclerotioniger CBS 115572 TaxID=1450535 RepID=A0A317WK88_9EURO|nr:S-adenosyl-L-methionine-dependent methyltransferase [Aspergillus sclerotioniger CBS 115572]PWY85692.1 S-adenosyl-L-methionine-dependent methyltransferase [Aspergillus sclerotioniger CBS 115572]
MAAKDLQPLGQNVPLVDVDENEHAQKQPWAMPPEPDSDDEVSINSYEAQYIDSVEENDRRYCNETYYMPNDEAEQTRLNIVHQIYLILLDGHLTAAPIATDAPRILDIGTGPGDWAIEMSTAYPHGTIIASDISVFDNGLGHVDLPNVFFRLDDARDDWAYHAPFDLIHLRGLSGAFPDWPFIYQQAFRHLVPGGYLEVADTDFAAETTTSLPTNSYLRLFFSVLSSAAESAGCLRDMTHLQPNLLSAHGFVDIHVHEYTFPIGLWPENPRDRTLGKMGLIALLEGLEAISLRLLTASYGWGPEEVRDLCDQVRAEILSGGYRVSVSVRMITGRKPLDR